MPPMNTSKGDIKRISLAGSLALALLAAPAAGWAQGGPPVTPVAVNIQKVPVGSWAEYAVSITPPKGEKMNGKARWALVSRNADGVSFEMSMEGGPTAMMGGQKMTSKMVLAPDPTKSDRPVRQLIMQMGDMDPFEMPAEAPQVQGQRFEKPDPKKLVGKETLKVPAGSFPTAHYRDKREQAQVDFWVSESIPPLGMVKMTVTPNAGTPGPNVVLELAAKGSDAKATITKPAKPFNPAMMGHPPGGGHPPAGGPPPGAPPPGGAPPAAAKPKK
jgi:hypothetical protein